MVQKSGKLTSWYGKYPIIYKVSYRWLAGFLNHEQYFREKLGIWWFTILGFAKKKMDFRISNMCNRHAWSLKVVVNSFEVQKKTKNLNLTAVELPDCWDGHIFPKPLETRGYSRYIPLDIQGHRNSVSAYSWTPKIYQSKMWKRHIHHLPTLQKSSLRWVMNWNTWAMIETDQLVTFIRCILVGFHRYPFKKMAYEIIPIFHWVGFHPQKMSQPGWNDHSSSGNAWLGLSHLVFQVMRWYIELSELSPCPGFQSPPGWRYISRIGEPKLNLQWPKNLGTKFW